MDSLQSRLKMSFPGRKKQIEQLCGLFGYQAEPFIDSIYIYGSSSTGKSALVEAVLSEFGIKNARVNLVECYTSKILFESILNQLANHKIDPSKGQPYAKCDNLMDFILHLRRCSADKDLNRAVIVVDKAERFRDMDFNLLAAFLRLRELSELPISVIFISEIVFELLYWRAANSYPIKIHFPQYTKEELFNILSLDFDYARATIANNFSGTPDFGPEFFQNYLNLFLSVFYRVCRNLSELRHMSRLNFVKYCEPVARKECKIEDAMALWRRIAPILKASLEVLYLRITPAARECKQQGLEAKRGGAQPVKRFAFTKENLAQSLELPFYAKYLLIAAYLASYNPTIEDKRLFAKYHGKKTKRMVDVKAKTVVSEQLNTQMGPKPFGFERLVAIFYAILEEKIDFNSNLLVQITTLVELQLLVCISDNCDLDSRKYKCCVSLDFIQVIAKTLGFDVARYLVDFN